MIWTFGDWSHDGHGHTQTLHLQSNYTPEAIGKAFKSVCETEGWEPHKWAENPWSSSSLERQNQGYPSLRLIEMGMKKEDVAYENTLEDDPAGWWIGGPEHHALFVQFVCQQVHPDLVLEEDRSGVDDLQSILTPNGYEGWGYGWDC